MTTPEPFSGPDRVEILKSFGRPVRLGTLEALKVSDAERVREAIRKGDATGAKDRLHLLHALHGALVTTYLEWAYAMRSAVAARHTPAVEQTVAERTFTTWELGLTSPAAPFREEAVQCVRSLLDPLRVGPTTIVEFRCAPKNPWSAILNRKPAEDFAALLRSVDEGAADPALLHFEAYLAATRDRHDLIGRHVALYATDLARTFGQKESIDLAQVSLESCALLGGMWTFVSQARPEDLALMLAEHLRAHFSGGGRDGAVEIVEEPDRYRLVFAPCGTGGVLRDPAIPGLTLLPDATPETWNRAGQVPAYCAHCAKNELTSITRLGFPAWVTEFDPDPAKPCGWTIYKDPKLIPARYFERLGLRPPEPKS